MISQLISETGLQAMGLALMHSLWQGAALALGLVFILWIMRHKPSMYRYWAGMATLGIFALTVAGTGVYSLHSLQGRTGSTQLLPTDGITALLGTHVIEGSNRGVVASIWQEPLIYFQQYFTEHAPLVVALWLLGVCLFSLRLLGSYVWAQRLRTYKTRIVEGEWQDRVAEFAHTMGIAKAVKLVESKLAVSPMTIGYWKPIILIPVGMLSGLPADQVEAIIAHELAHIRRNDYLLNLVQSVIETVLFYHPATWWISNLIRAEREHACDDLAIAACGNQLAFAKALTSIEEGSFKSPYLVMAWKRNQGLLLQRIKHILGEPAKQFQLPEHLVIASLILLSICSLAFGLPQQGKEKLINQPSNKSEKIPSGELLASTRATWEAVNDTTKKKKRTKVIVMEKSEKPDKEFIIVEERIVGEALPSPPSPPQPDSVKSHWIFRSKNGTLKEVKITGQHKDSHYIITEDVVMEDGQKKIIIIRDGTHRGSMDMDSLELEMNIVEIPDNVFDQQGSSFTFSLDSPTIRIDSIITKAEIEALKQVEKAMQKHEIETVKQVEKAMQKHEKAALKQVEKAIQEHEKAIEKLKEAELKEVEKEMKERMEELERAHEQIERNRERLEEQREVIIIEERLADRERQEHNSKLWNELRAALAKDGLIKSADSSLKLYLSDELLRVNGKVANKKQYKKYRKMIMPDHAETGSISWSHLDSNTHIIVEVK